MIKNHAALRRVVTVLFLFVSNGCKALGDDRPDAYQGIVELDEWILGFELPGRLRDVTAERGRVVAAGERLAALDSGMTATARTARSSEAAAAAAQVSLLKAGSRVEEIRAAEAQVRAARATEELLQKTLAREKSLRERNASTDAAVEELAGKLERATAERQSFDQRLSALRRGSRAEEVSVAEARAAGATAQVTIEEERLRRHELLSPAAGVVLDVHVKAGEVVGAGGPVVTLGDPKHPYADVFVPQGKLAGLTVGVPAEVRVDGESSTFPGAIETIARKTEFTPRFLFSARERPNLVVRVRVRIADPGERLHAGVPAFVVFRPEGKKQ